MRPPGSAAGPAVDDRLKRAWRLNKSVSPPPSLPPSRPQPQPSLRRKPPRWSARWVQSHSGPQLSPSLGRHRNTPPKHRPRSFRCLSGRRKMVHRRPINGRMQVFDPVSGSRRGPRRQAGRSGISPRTLQSLGKPSRIRIAGRASPGPSLPRRRESRRRRARPSEARSWGIQPQPLDPPFGRRRSISHGTRPYRRRPRRRPRLHDSRRPAWLRPPPLQRGLASTSGSRRTSGRNHLPEGRRNRRLSQPPPSSPPRRRRARTCRTAKRRIRWLRQWNLPPRPRPGPLPSCRARRSGRCLCRSLAT